MRTGWKGLNDHPIDLGKGKLIYGRDPHPSPIGTFQCLRISCMINTMEGMEGYAEVGVSMLHRRDLLLYSDHDINLFKDFPVECLF